MTDQQRKGLLAWLGLEKRGDDGHDEAQQRKQAIEERARGLI